MKDAFQLKTVVYPLVLFLAIVGNIIVFIQSPPNYATMRVQLAAPFNGLQYAKKFHGDPAAVFTDHNDDRGLYYLFGAAYLLSYSKAEILQLKEEKHELPFIVIFGAILLTISIFALFLLMCQLAGPQVAFAVNLLLLLNPNFAAQFLFLDVYCFQVLAACLTGFWAIRLYQAKKSPPAYLYVAVVLGLFVCEVMRSGSMIVLLGLFLPLVFLSRTTLRSKKIYIRGAGITLLAIILVNLAVSFEGSPIRKHTFWHPMAWGLFENGVYIDRGYFLFPGFLPKEKIPEGAKFRERGRDYDLFHFAKNINPKMDVYSEEYNQLMQDIYFVVWSKYPFRTLGLYFKKFLNTFKLNPFQPLGSDTELASDWFTTTTQCLALVLCFLGLLFYWGKVEVFFVMPFLTLIIPSTLVVSNQYRYNFVFHPALYFLCFLAAIAILKRLKKIKHGQQ